MSYEHTIEAAIEGIHEIEDLLKHFAKQDQIAAIEMDLTLQKMRSLYELLLMMKGREAISQEPSQEVRAKDPAPVKNDMAELVMEKTELTEVKTTVEVKEVTAVHEPATDIVSQVITSSKEKKTQVERQTKTLADQFSSGPTLHEALHHGKNKDDVLFTHNKPVTDIASAIGINDRFTFIHELFGNDKNLYDNTLVTLNQAASFNDAYNFMIHNFDWDMNSDPVQLLLDIVRRKFIKGRNE